MAKKIILRSWRVMHADPSGLFVWYDPTRESVELFELDPPKNEGVAIACEGDDQIDMYDPQSGKNELDHELPF